jgi:glycerate dehydrogenase
MKIVVLDGYTLNPGDMSWDELNSLGDCEIYDRTLADQVLPRAGDAEIILTNKTLVSGEHIRGMPQLKYIGVLATGYNIVDVAAARERRVPVTNVPSYGTRSVAQHTFALLLELTHHVGHHAQSVRDGRWTKSPDFCYWDFPLVELEGLTMGIVGLGRIGRAVAELALAFGMRVLAHSRTVPVQQPNLHLHPTRSEIRPETDAETLPAHEGVGGESPQALKVAFVDLERLFRQSDVISLHCPLTPQTRHLVNRDRLSSMKPTAFLLNTSRGPLLDETALAAALNSGKLAGAGLDVLSVEPPPPGNPLVEAKNCLITPHIAWATRAARVRLMQSAVENIRAFLAGTPRNVVN